MADGIMVEVNILSSLKPTTVIFSPMVGDYKMQADSQVFEISTQDLAYLTAENGKIRVKTLEGEQGHFSVLKITASENGSSFKLKTVVPYGRMRAYDDNLDIQVSEGALTLLNRVGLDKYVAGVVKSEVGPAAHKEFYKVQSIICRTYAMSNFRRHELESFQLCDQVHCQVYGGKCTEVDPSSGLRYPRIGDIVNAAAATSNIVIVDHDLELIEAAFHANCGGHTVNSEDAWTQHKSYLRGVRDTFCIAGRNYSWEKTVGKAKWLNYLDSKYSYPVGDIEERVAALGFSQPDRLVYYCGREEIPLKRIRKDWMLSSGFFSITDRGEQLVLKGRGYGHGVGLCQQGAMEMAKVGIAYKEMLLRYYTNISLIDMASLQYLLK
jgi:stage II sporulation protein D